MDYLVSAITDAGLYKKNNQDNFLLKVINTKKGRMVFTVLCDGMGGLEKGEIASATVINAFDRWSMKELPLLCEQSLTINKIVDQWDALVLEQNEIIKVYGKRWGIKLGTTVVAMLITPKYYFVINVGDSRAYELDDSVYQITKDHSLVAKEVDLGNLTWDEAEKDKRNNILLQCIGASGEVYPDVFVGVTKKNATYMLCSDGFRHMITKEEIYSKLRPEILENETVMKDNINELISLNKQRNEKDNISVIVVKTTNSQSV